MMVASWFLSKKKKSVRAKTNPKSVKQLGWMDTEFSSGKILIIFASWFLWKKKTRAYRNLPIKCQGNTHFITAFCLFKFCAALASSKAYGFSKSDLILICSCLKNTGAGNRKLLESLTQHTNWDGSSLRFYQWTLSLNLFFNDFLFINTFENAIIIFP